jgi:hypothetical protein
MKGMARISHDQGGVILPARSTYDLELVHEYATAYARRHGRVQLWINGGEWRVANGDGSASGTCSACAAALVGVTYANGVQRLCARCARTGERLSKPRGSWLARLSGAA